MSERQAIPLCGIFHGVAEGGTCLAALRPGERPDALTAAGAVASMPPPLHSSSHSGPDVLTTLREPALGGIGLARVDPVPSLPGEPLHRGAARPEVPLELVDALGGGHRVVGAVEQQDI